MVLVIGGIFQGKGRFIQSKYAIDLKKTLKFNKYEDDEYVVLQNCHQFEGDLFEYISSIGKLLICTTTIVGNAIVPQNKEERLFRDNVGILNKKLLIHAKEAYRLWNGIDEKIK